ncbi:MAG: type II toxin-antitoxin system prevent-host-death family antitoxin [Patescibacteria group bacterium]|nr:type II toxin-antitoxin system prevent-host-death family antitoxin [Patescibacteria group bacterium]
MFIPTDNNISTITDMRENAISLLQSVQKKQSPTIIMHRNSPKAILLSVTRYNQLMEMVEDYLDEELVLKLEKQRKTAKKSDYIPFEKVLKEFNIDV